LLIGPEGGFSDTEIDGLLKKQVKPMSLGPRILRAETAAIVGLTLLGQQYGQY
jgi:16S rRNA (uracil1498-N3)-methyltransferase